MAYFVGAIVAVLLAIYLISRRKRRPAWSMQTTTKGGYAIPATAIMLDAEHRDNDEVMRLLEIAIRASGIFRIESIPELVSKLRGGAEPFARVNTKIAFEGEEILSVEQKRMLGLNTRLKYSKAFVSYFDPACLKTIEPKSALENMHLSAFHHVARKRDLLQFRELGFVQRVRIVPVGDARDCGEIKRFKKVHDVNEAPELPLPGCKAPYCRCMFEAIISQNATAASKLTIPPTRAR